MFLPCKGYWNIGGGVWDTGKGVWNTRKGFWTQGAEFGHLASKEAQDKGRATAHENRDESSKKSYETPGTDPIVVREDNKKNYMETTEKFYSYIWDYKGNCELYCAEQVTLKSFVNVTNLAMHKWLVSHDLTSIECNYNECSGKGVVIAHGDGVALKCTTCKKISVGGHRGFWRMGKLPTVMMVNIVFSVVNGFSLSVLEQVIHINKNTWSSYIQYVGIVLRETLERNRRDPEQKYELAQWDETAFGKRKYERGKRVRKAGVQWALTVVKFFTLFTLSSCNESILFTPNSIFRSLISKRFSFNSTIFAKIPKFFT